MPSREQIVPPIQAYKFVSVPKVPDSDSGTVSYMHLDTPMLQTPAPKPRKKRPTTSVGTVSYI